MRVIRIERPEWHADAACRGQGTQLWFPPSGKSAQSGKAVCAPCAAREACLAAALADPTLVGVWGGTSEKERDRLRAKGART
jgi:WhiB family redox-sensing transcriptional regulator